MNAIRRLFTRIDNGFSIFERWLLVVLLFSMIAIAFTQVVLRNVFSFGIEWGDVAVRHLVLWVGLIGASIAAKEKRHLSIDIASRLLPQKWSHLLEAFLNLVTVAVCILFLWASILFSKFLYEIGTGTLEGFTALLACLILPLSFFAIASRFLLRLFWELGDFRKKTTTNKNPE